MNILLLYSDSDAFSDLCEMMQIFNVHVHAARSQAEAVSILVSRSIDAAIFTLRTLADLEFLKYLNTSYPQIKIFLFVEKTLRDIISILKDGQYQVVPASCPLSEWWKRSLEAIMNAQEPTADVGS
ncbi:MAG: hypothetical protein RBT80_21925 [Candidatus Vecturithrix sp.]|jgi:hypothetical protein|nr:hypothetical protein [Candidatus Vecturithrix sp.]